MNEKFIHAFISKTDPKAQRPNKMKKVQYPDGAVTMEKDCDRG